MENSAELEVRNLIKELTLGRELARQLRIHINAPSSTLESRELLIHKILNSYEKALDLVKSTSTNAGAGAGETTTMTTAASEFRSHQSTTVLGMSESPGSRSLSGSPRSEDSDREFRDQDPGVGDASSRKRKITPRWTKHIQVCPGTGLEGPLEDGFSWRKYGQKDILGAKYPRGYYRCTHRHVQGCLATKQVQRSDGDTTIFEVTYRGKHTCTQGSESNPTSAPAEKPEPSSQGNYQQLSQPEQNQQEMMLLNFQKALKVETEDLETQNQQFPFPIFNFPSASATSIKQESGTLFPPLTDNNNFSGNLSPTFMPPSTNGSNYFSASPTDHTSAFPGMPNPYIVESDFTDLISAATSTTNPPTVGMDFPFSQTEFDPNFTFDHLGFFS